MSQQLFGNDGHIKTVKSSSIHSFHGVQTPDGETLGAVSICALSIPETMLVEHDSVRMILERP